MNILKTSAIALMIGALPVAVQAQQMPAGANHMPRPMGGGESRHLRDCNFDSAQRHGMGGDCHQGA